MSARIKVLINATANGDKCHRQCPHLVLIDEGHTCAAFKFPILMRDQENRILRCRDCIVAQARAERLSRKAAPHQFQLHGVAA